MAVLTHKRESYVIPLCLGYWAWRKCCPAPTREHCCLCAGSTSLRTGNFNASLAVGCFRYPNTWINAAWPNIAIVNLWITKKASKPACYLKGRLVIKAISVSAALRTFCPIWRLEVRNKVPNVLTAAIPVCPKTGPTGYEEKVQVLLKRLLTLTTALSSAAARHGPQPAAARSAPRRLPGGGRAAQRRLHCAAAAGRTATGRVPGAGCGDGGGASAEPAGLPQPSGLLLRPQRRRGDRGGRPAAACGRGFFLRGRSRRRCRPPARLLQPATGSARRGCGRQRGRELWLSSRELGRASDVT